MRRFWLTVFSLVSSGLALAGGPNGVMICLHTAGAFPAAAVSAEFDREAEECGDCVGDSCSSEGGQECRGCYDVEVKGLDLAQLRVGDDADKARLPQLVVTAVLPLQTTTSSSASNTAKPAARAPPGEPQALVVARTSVLLL